MKTLKTNPNKTNLDDLGHRMASLDLSSVPPEKRKAALMDHFLKIQEDTIEDREIAAQINLSRRLLHMRSTR